MSTWKRTLALWTLWLPLALASCAKTSAFGLHSDDNNATAIAAVSARIAAGLPAPVRASDGKARMFAVTAGDPKQLVAYELANGAESWRVDANVSSRVVVGGDVLVAAEGAELVGRLVASGAVKWKVPLGGKLVGLDAGRGAVARTVQRGEGAQMDWELAVLELATGETRWAQVSDGQLGAPALAGDLVLSPFLRQWITVIDAGTGLEVTRLRGVDEEITYLVSNSTGVYFGARKGIYRFDPKAASGKQSESTFVALAVPEQLKGAAYAPDAYDLVDAGYSAHDRQRLLWHPGPASGDALTFANDGFAVHHFRFMFGYKLGQATPSLAWAYSHPRADLVASANLGTCVAGVSAAGDVVCVDLATGVPHALASLVVKGKQVLGATFDAGGFVPTVSGSEKAQTAAALLAIVKDRDTRFEKIKELAVEAMVASDDPQVASALLAVYSDARVSARLKEVISAKLAGRSAAGDLDHYVRTLEARADFIDNTTTAAVAPAVSAIAAIARKQPLAPETASRAVAALVPHLNNPDSSLADTANVVACLGAIGGEAATAALISHVMILRRDDLAAEPSAWTKTVAETLATLGGASALAQETLRFVASDDNAGAGLAGEARRVLTAK